MNIFSTLGLFFLTVSVTAITLECPGNLKTDRYLRHFGTHCYQFTLNHPGDWFHADSDCRGKGGYLVDIHSSSEQAFIFNSLQFLGLHGDKGVWIGLTDKDKEGTWRWTSGTNVNFNFWARGQPGSLFSANEDCALMQLSSGGTWHDYPCDSFLLTKQNHGWVCKFAEVPLTTTLPSTMQTTTLSAITSMVSTQPPSAKMSTSAMSSSKLMSSLMPSASTARMSSPVQISVINTMMSSTMMGTEVPITQMSSTSTNLMTSPGTNKLLMSSSPMNTMMSSTVVSSPAMQTIMSSPASKSMLSSLASNEMKTTTMSFVSTT